MRWICDLRDTSLGGYETSGERLFSIHSLFYSIDFVILPSSFSNKAPICPYFVTMLEMVGLMAKKEKKRKKTPA
jgi:hypothetical protein